MSEFFEKHIKELHCHLLVENIKKSYSSAYVLKFSNDFFFKLGTLNLFYIFLNANLEIVQTYQTLLQTLVNRICTLKLTKADPRQILGSQEEGRKLRI